MAKDFELEKWDRKVWAVFDRRSRTFSHIGKGKRYCQRKVEELNSVNYETNR